MARSHASLQVLFPRPRRSASFFILVCGVTDFNTLFKNGKVSLLQLLAFHRFMGAGSGCQIEFKLTLAVLYC